MSACVYRPKVEGTDNPSKLFDELTRYYGPDRRDDAITMYAASQLPSIARQLQDKEKDSNGEPTIEALNEVLPLDSVILDKETDINVLRRNLGAVNAKGENILYDIPQDVMVKVNDFNLKHSKYTATVHKTVGGKYYIQVDERNAANKVEAANQMFSNNLYNRLRAILNRAGFDVKVEDTKEYNGIFDPLNMQKTVDNLKTIIKIAKGEKGEEAFPEEFAHFIIEGLRNEPFVQRLLKTITSEIIQSVLGEEYNTYDELYNGDEDMMQREVAARILQSHILGTPIAIEKPKSLLERLWERIKSIFKSIKESDIDNAIEEANTGFAQLADAVVNESIIPLIDTTNFSRALYSTAKSVNRLQEIAEKGLGIASKRLVILKSKTKSGKVDKAIEANVKTIDDQVKKKQYALACSSFLKDTLSALEGLNRDIKQNLREANTIQTIKSNSKVLRQIEEFMLGYADIVKEMKIMPSIRERGEADLEEQDAIEIAGNAALVDKLLDELRDLYKEKRYEVLLNFLEMYYGKEQLITVGKDKGKQLSITQIMDMADHDIGFLDQMISSMSDASDPMLSIVHRITVEQQDKRDDELKDIFSNLKVLEKELRDAGYTSDFMIERDADGKKTGNFISDIDYIKYYKERSEYKKQLKEEGKDATEMKVALEKWENSHTEDLINPYSRGTIKQVERIPKRSMYKSNALNGLSQAQRKYYDAMIDFKQQLQALIPNRYIHTYRAIQIPQNFFEGVGTNPINTAKQFFTHLQDRFVRREFDLDYGEDIIDPATKRVILDFSGNPLQKLPVYYTGRLKDMDRLSTDVTSSMIAFASMAVNYSKMSEIIDAMELLRSFIHEREFSVTSGDSSLYEQFSNAGRKFINKYTKKGKAGNIGKRIDDFYESVIYGHKKIDQGSIPIPGTNKSLDVAESLDALKEYTGLVGLGLNTFSAISNVTVGKMQLWIEAAGGEYFGVRDLIKARAEYYKLLAPYMGELNDSTKSSKMAILIDEFDALEEFYNDLKNTKYTGVMRKFMDNASLLFMQNMGEHYLHTGTMFAILYSRKVKLNGQDTSLYNAMDIAYATTSDGKKVGGRVIFKDGSKLEDGTELFSNKHLEELRTLSDKKAQGKISKEEEARIGELKQIQATTNKYLREVRFQINKVNQSLNGAFNERDKGAIHRNALGRLAMQFRQWMPGHYYRRFAGTYYDAMLGQWREGYYRTLGKFTLNCLRDISKAKFQIATNWKSLSNHEKANMKRSLAELMIFASLAGLIAMLGPVKKDKDNTWHDRMLAYQLRRLYLEAGASIPLTPDFFKNITTMLQSPAAAIKSFNNLAGLLEFWNIWNEVESGRYKGWSVYRRDFVNAIPVYGAIRKNIDLPNETYMFNVFDK